MTTATPQKMQALALANKKRLAGANLRKEIGALSQRDAKLRVAELLDDPTPEVASLRLRWLLLAIPWFGTVKMHQLLARIRMPGAADKQVGPNERKPWGTLTERERHTIAMVLRAGVEEGTNGNDD